MNHGYSSQLDDPLCSSVPPHASPTSATSIKCIHISTAPKNPPKMNPYEDLPESVESSVASLPRTKCTFDFSKLLSRRQRASRTSENRMSTTSSRRSQSNQSENSQILYMPEPEKPKEKRATGRSLSSMSNGASRRFDGSADSKFDLDSPADTMSRNIIDREIFEWQYVCQSGRPYWWSPESKFARLQKLQQRVASEQEERFGMQGIGNAPKARYEMRRRAMTDSYLADPSAVHDLAHLVAVQLLGACFTLPPDSITAVTPEYTRDEDGICTVRNSRLISSLRMHTHFRYSPSFGHQARNTSPVQIWPRRYDGPNAGYSSVRSNTNTSTPNIGTSSPCHRRNRSHRPLHNTEGSASRKNDDEDEDYIRTCCNNNELDSSVGATAWYRRQGVHDANNRSITMPHMPSAGSKRRAARAPECSRDEDAGASSRGGPSTLKTNYRLQPVLRSEPHPIFIQPVRELVVKRWRNFRRRMSGSLHSALSSRASEDLASASESSEASSPVLSSDAKIRRLRAQERGDIHSSSVDSTPHCNSPRSGQLSPNGEELALSVRSLASVFPLGDPLAAVASLVMAEASRLRVSNFLTPHASIPSDTISARELIRSSAASTLAVCDTSHTRSELPSLSPSSKPNTPFSTYSLSSQRSMNRQRRRSMLSEVCTPEDFHTSKSPDTEGTKEPITRSILSTVGSTLASPEEKVSAYPFGPRRIHEVLSSPGPSVLPTLAELRGFKEQDRPKMSRTSTNGTQIFTPSDDGVEIDGLPAGPSREIWAGKGGRRERTYL
ncbi:hypothetical protein BDZ45DRAFT_740869 [Acephala macrosclerotiorum]|nr:hypothetical protein BDZ45DRAFT_740869 [Acephala macrosclerotiorum]